MPGQLSGRKRAAALRLKISAWSPFQETGYAVQWSGDQVSVYAWDADAVQDRISAHGYRPSDFEIVPAAFMQDPLETGIRLAVTSDGYEGQVWRSGHLAITRWWNTLPSPQEWAMFRRSAGQVGEIADLDYAETITAEWLERAWTNASSSGDLLTQVISNKQALVWVGTAALIPCAFLVSQWLTYVIAGQSVQRSIAAIEETSLQSRQQRSAALSALDAVEDYLSLKRHPDQIEIMSAAHNILRRFPVILSNWDYDDGDLQFGLESEENMDSRAFISAFEESAMFSQVSASTRGERLILRMRVAPLSGGPA